jgi:hypothetical protein
VSDISFDKNGKVAATRFRFAHTPVQYQDDFIRDLILTRRVADLFSSKLTQNPDNSKKNNKLKSFDSEENLGFTSRLARKLGLQSLLAKTETTAPVAFTYSLFYVFYDQYTYIRGVLAQNALLGVAAVILSLQILSSLSIAVIIGACVFLVLFQLMGTMWMLNEVFGSYPIEMNAVFVVNLVTSLGFGVEFCNHIGMNFMRQTGDKETRAKKAL